MAQRELDVSKLKYMHIRRHQFSSDPVPPKGGITVAYLITGKVIHLSTAVTSKKDVYCKQTGRTLAYNRFISGEKIILPYHGKMSWIHAAFSNLLK